MKLKYENAWGSTSGVFIMVCLIMQYFIFHIVSQPQNRIMHELILPLNDKLMISSVSLRSPGKVLSGSMRHIILVSTANGKLHLPTQAASFAKLLVREAFTGKAGETYTFNDGQQYLIFVGVGDENKLHPSSFHKPLGNAIKAQLQKAKTLAIVPGDLLNGKDREAILTELLMTGRLASYRFDKYRTGEKKEKMVTSELVFLLDKPSKNDQTLLERTKEIAESVAWTRDIVNEPSNATTPRYLAYLLKSDEKKAPFRVEIFDSKKIQEMGMNLIYAVGKGSSEEPYFAKVTYMGDSSTKKFVALVGKGVNFDTGGVQVKPDTYMNTMKGDMGGAAMVMGTLHALARLKAKVNVIGYLPFVENAVDGAAYRPDDVYTAINGKTVEIKHTDAEGRLILADAVAYASLEKPTEILDFATLTGAAVVALGNKYAAVMGTNEKGMKRLQELGKEVNEHVWPLPLEMEYRKYLDSEIADIANISEKRMAGTIMGGVFIHDFVDEKIPWMHLDIAGVATGTKNNGIHSEFATGYGVRLMVEYLTRK